MPEISIVFGMSIKMVFHDHDPPHIHVLGGDVRCRVDFDGNVMSGRIPVNKMRILKEWINENKEALQQGWKKARQGIKPERIKGWD